MCIKKTSIKLSRPSNSSLGKLKRICNLVFQICILPLQFSVTQIQH